MIPNDNLNFGQKAWRRMLQLDKPSPARSEADVAAEVARNYPWNFTVNLLDGVWFWFGLYFVSSTTIVPLFVSKLTSNAYVIGLVAVIAQAGWYLPQLLAAGPIEGVARKKPIVINLGLFLERLPTWLWPVAALLAFYWPKLALIVFFIGFAWHHLGAGLIGPAWQELIARCFPVQRRGRFFGLTNFLGTGTGALGGLLSAWILKNYPFPFNFALTFLVGAAGITISWGFLALTREPVQAVPDNQHRPPMWRKLRQVLRDDHNYRRFMIARLALALGTMSLGFVTVAALFRWNVADSTVALYTVAQLLGQTVGSLLCGWLADRYGHKLSLELGAISFIIAALMAWLAPSSGWYFAVFAFLGFSIGSTIVSGLLIILEFPKPESRPTYVGITNTGVGLVSGLAPIFGGWLAGFSYDLLFAMSAVVSLVALILLRFTVQDPRQISFEDEQAVILDPAASQD